MTPSPAISRRGFLAATGAVAATLALGPLVRAQDATTHRYRIAACDWMMLKRQTPGAITRAREVGCDGVETDMGSLSKNPTFVNKFLQEPGFTEHYLQLCRENNIQISSVAMSGYYAWPFTDRPYELPLQDCIKTMGLLDVSVAFLPLGGTELRNKPERRPELVRRLREVGTWAGDAGKIIGIETGLDAAADCELLAEIDRPAIRIYYNFQNGVRSEAGLVSELQTLGKDRICQIHPTNDDKFWLEEDPAIDMPKVKETLDAMGWSGWLVIERSRRADRGRDVIGNFSANAAYLKSIFQAS
jgi:sugar phosphate isomerase/epimerase